MKKIILFAFLCLLSLGSKAQIVIDAVNIASCNVIAKIVAIDPVTCAIVAVASGPVAITAGAPPSSTTITLSPAPTSNFILAAYVFYSGCPGATAVLVGPGGPCGFNPTDYIPTACGCGPDLVDFPSGILPPTYPPFIHFPINVHP